MKKYLYIRLLAVILSLGVILCFATGCGCASRGLTYSLINNGTEYEVTGIGSCRDNELVIPSTYSGKPVTGIADSAFSNCSSLTAVEIPSSVKSVGSSAFYNCSSLDKVNYTGTIDQWVQISFGNLSSNPSCYTKGLYINDSLVTKVELTTATKISNYAFYNCASITRATISSSVESIGSRAFFGCGLTSVTIDSGVKSIGSSAFSNCTSLTSVDIPRGVTSIGEYAFSGNEELANVKIPSSVNSIGSNAFYNCTSLTKVNYLGTINQWVQIEFGDAYANPIMYAKDLYVNALFTTDVLVTQAVLTGMTKISSFAFYNCKSLTSVVIPSTVTTIGKSAFCNCDSINRVYYGGMQDEWTALNSNIGDYNTKLTWATRYYYVENQSDLPNDGGNYWRFVNGVPTPWTVT